MAARTRLPFDPQDITRPSGFPISTATLAYLDRTSPLLSAQNAGLLQNAFGLGITALSGLVFIWRFFQGQHATDDRRFRGMLHELAGFEAAIRDRAEVLECYTLTGEWDFLLKIVTRNVKAYEAFYLDYLSRIPCVRSVNSSVAVTVIKESTALPLGAR